MALKFLPHGTTSELWILKEVFHRVNSYSCTEELQRNQSSGVQKSKNKELHLEIIIQLDNNNFRKRKNYFTSR